MNRKLLRRWLLMAVVCAALALALLLYLHAI